MHCFSLCRTWRVLLPSDTAIQHFLCRVCCPAESHYARLKNSMRLSSSKESPTSHLVSAKQVGVPSSSVGNPMEILSRVFLQSKIAVLQHRELITHLADGNDKKAAQMAEALSKTIRAVRQEDSLNTSEAVSHNPSVTPTEGTTPSNLSDESEEPAKSGIQYRISQGVAAGGVPQHSADALRIVLLESQFESLEEEESSSSVVEREAKDSIHMNILNHFLEEEGEKWKSQKRCLADIILRTAKAVGLVPLDIHGAERNLVTGNFNPVTHANIVIRGEIPDSVQYKDAGAAISLEEMCVQELDALRKKMIELHTPLSELEEKMALFEIRRSKTVMRYSIGIKQNLQLALDTSDGVKKVLREMKQYDKMTGSALFINEAIRVLNSFSKDGGSAVSVIPSLSLSADDVALIEKPVIPFTFMLKCCLWFDIA